MKLRLLAVTAALLALGYAIPFGLAQDQVGAATKDEMPPPAPRPSPLRPALSPQTPTK